MARLRKSAQPIAEIVDDLVTADYAELIGDLIEDAPVGRRRTHPTWLFFTYGALIRHFRSAARLDAELATGLWDTLRTRAVRAGRPDPGLEPFTYQYFNYWRNVVTGDEELMAGIAHRFTRLAVGHARNLGLIASSGGSVTNPHPTRVIYGDGTVVRSPYRPPNGNSQRRVDPSATIHIRHDGEIYGNDFVWFCVRDEQPHSRVILAVDWVPTPTPGVEAHTAMDLIEHIHGHAGGGIQAIVYDGAMKGVHLDRIMRNTGYMVINKVAVAAVGEDGTTTPKQRPFRTVTHPTAEGKCRHTLHVRNGTIVDVTLADDGTAVIAGEAIRRQVKRARRSDGTYRFDLSVTIPCRHGDFDIWASPHATPDQPWLPEHIRLLPPDDPSFGDLYGMRNDVESLNNTFKRSLLVDRATSVGWQRQLIDMYSYAVLHNSTAQQVARSAVRRMRAA
jgi:hypothetical protein